MDQRPANQRLTSVMLARGVAELCALDADIAGVVQRIGLPPLWLRPPGFASLIKMILEQQVSLASARAAYRRLQATVGRVTPHNVLAVNPASLRSAGITQQKARYCQELARQVIAGSLDLRQLQQLPDQEVCSRLVKLPGIGPWTADVYLLMALGRVDVWPFGDVALATAVGRLKRLDQRPGYEQLTEMAAVWSPWRAVAARILWHYYLRGMN